MQSPSAVMTEVLCRNLGGVAVPSCLKKSHTHQPQFNVCKHGKLGVVQPGSGSEKQVALASIRVLLLTWHQCLRSGGLTLCRDHGCRPG